MNHAFLPIKAPIRTMSELNAREHWAHRNKRRSWQRTAIRYYLNVTQPPSLPVTLLLTRIAPRKLDEGDNLPSSFKAIRDEIAAWLGVDDGGGSVQWQYAQKRGSPGEYGVLIEVIP